MILLVDAALFKDNIMSKFLRLAFLLSFAFITSLQIFSCSSGTNSSPGGSDSNNDSSGNNGNGASDGSPTASGQTPTEGSGAASYSGTLPSNIASLTPGSLSVSGSSRSLSLYRPNSSSNQSLVIALPGSGGDLSDYTGDGGYLSVANSDNVLFVFPAPRDNVQDSWDHGSPGSPGDGTFWDTENDNANTNPDLLFFRAIIQQASSQFSINANRVYVIGHSNGAFMAALTAQVLRSQIAAFAENAGGLVTCPPRIDGDYSTSLTSCSAILADGAVPSRLKCSSSSPTYDPEPVVAFSSGAKRPGYLAHGNNDDTVSVYYTCNLYQDLNSKGYPTQVNIVNGFGHALTPNFVVNAWNFMKNYSL